MADWANPQLTSTYANFVTEVKNRDLDLAVQFDGVTVTNITTGTIRWSSTANRWQKWSGTAWGELATTYALTGLSTTGSATIGTTLGVTGVATLSGGGTSTTPTTDNNTTNIATTAFVVGQAASVAPLIAGTAAVGTSLRYARQDHRHPTDTTRAPLASPTFTGTVTIPAGASISGFAPLASPAFTGTPTSITPATADNNTSVATTAFVKAQGYAPLASPAFTGTPSAPTATTGTNTTQLATTAFVAASSVPAGAVTWVAMNTAPTGYLKANGAAVSRTTYATLFAAIGTTFGAGNGSTTFALPDLRGEFIRGWADGRAVDTGRTFGSAQADAFASHQHTVGIDSGGDSWSQGGNQFGVFGSVTGFTGGNETRPRNIALLACIKF